MIRGKWMLALGAVLLASAAVATAPLSSARAARAERATLSALAPLGDDHLDAPGVRGDPAADITDVLAFMSPDPATPHHLVLVMNVAPWATTTSTFAEHVDYAFRIRRVAAGAPIAFEEDALDVVCTFASGTMTCNAPSSLTASAALNQVAGAPGDAMRVFAGLRSDPLFFDRDAYAASVASGALKLSDAGTNAFAGQNVLGLVVEIDAALAFGGTDAGVPTATLSVAAETKRTGI